MIRWLHSVLTVAIGPEWTTAIISAPGVSRWFGEGDLQSRGAKFPDYPV